MQEMSINPEIGANLVHRVQCGDVDPLVLMFCRPYTWEDADNFVELKEAPITCLACLGSGPPYRVS